MTSNQSATSNRSFFTTKVFLTLMGCCLVAISTFLWKNQESRNLSQLYSETESTARSYSNDTEIRFNRINNALIRLANKGIPSNLENSDDLKNDAAFFVDSFIGVERIAWVDENFTIRMIAPLNDNEMYINQNVNDMILDPSEVNFLVPAYNGTELQGFILGTINIDVFISPVINAIKNNYMLKLTDEGNTIFVSENWTTPQEKFVFNQTITLQNTAVLNFSFAPTQEYLDSEVVSARGTFLFGLIFSFITILAVHFAQNYNALSKLNESRFRKLLEDVELVAVILDVNGRVTFCNDYFLTLTDWKRKEVLEQDWFARFVQPDEELGKEVFQAAIFNGKTPTHSENLIISRTGEKRWVMFNNTILRNTRGHPIGIASLGEDITERKRMEQTLQDERQRLAGIIKGTNAGTWEWNVQTGETIFNDRWAEIIGYTLDEISPVSIDTWGKYAHPDDLKVSEALLEKHFTGVLDYYAYESRMKHKEGKWIWVVDRGKVISWTKGGKPLMMMGTHQDITESKKAEEKILSNQVELQSLLEEAKLSRQNLLSVIENQKRAEAEKETIQNQLLHSQKMESVGRLAGGMAHDFNNLLGVIMGHAETALNKIPPNQAGFQDLQEILKASRRSADLIHQLLAFARKQTISPKVLNLNDTITDMLIMLKRVLGEDIEMEWRPGFDLEPIKMDPSQVDQVLVNLLVNARDAINGVGKIVIETENIFLNDVESQITGLIRAEYILLRVSDTGCGMDKETFSHLFEPFFTTKEMGKGTGLGLATVFGIIKQNNGGITVKSEVGKGTIFNIYLPPCGERVVAVDKVVKNTPLVRGSETILMVEDEEALLELSKDTLEDLGYVVFSANTPADALRLAQEPKREFQLLITDVIMPGMNGKTLALEITLLRPGIKCLFMSGYTADIIADHGVLDENAFFIQKPFSLAELADKVRQALEN